MVFTSLFYLFFIGFVAITYYILPGKYRWILLLIASIGYYLSFIPVYLLLLLVLVAINYLLAGWLAKVPSGRMNSSMFFIVLFNIGVLAIFKYSGNLLSVSWIHIRGVEFFGHSGSINRLIMPLGLSYFIFTVLSYHIEIKRKNIEPEKNFGYFSLYLLFFPRIAQGPIERPQNLLPQLRKPHPLDYGMISDGLKMMLWGYFKKLVVADRLAIYVDPVYNNYTHHNGTSLIIATFLYAFQIYADFSGYTDIALGSARLFGFNLTNNFRMPYLADSIKDFWNRWHITLSTWIRDYIFLPLAYFFSGRFQREKLLLLSKEKWLYMAATLITFAVCGLWHGEGWTFLCWGLLFGIYLSCSNWTGKTQKDIRKRLKIQKSSTSYRVYSIILTFLLVSFTWVLFRSDSLGSAMGIFKKIFTTSGIPYHEEIKNLVFGLSGLAVLVSLDLKREFFNDKLHLLYNNKTVVRIASITFLIIAILLIGVLDSSQFIYFQF
jgi:alginate O-acetyltransferase complex protein AlgI